MKFFSEEGESITIIAFEWTCYSVWTEVMSPCSGTGSLAVALNQYSWWPLGSSSWPLPPCPPTASQRSLHLSHLQHQVCSALPFPVVLSGNPKMLRCTTSSVLWNIVVWDAFHPQCWIHSPRLAGLLPHTCPEWLFHEHTPECWQSLHTLICHIHPHVNWTRFPQAPEKEASLSRKLQRLPQCWSWSVDELEVKHTSDRLLAHPGRSAKVSSEFQPPVTVLSLGFKCTRCVCVCKPRQEASILQRWLWKNGANRT